MVKPNFFIIGAPKSGTTALSAYLGAHPNVFMSTPKEPHYFATDFPNMRFVQTPQAYASLFGEVKNQHQAVGEASVWYLYSEVAVRQIRAYNPAARILIMVRNPVDLVHSMHSQALYTRDEDQTDFQRAWDLASLRREGIQVPKHCRETRLVLYDEIANIGAQVERTRAVFPERQIKLVFFEDFVSATERVYRDILEFLGLPNDGRTTFAPVNENKRHKWLWLGTLTSRPPRVFVRAAMQLKQLFGIPKLGALPALTRLNTRVAPRNDLDPQMRARVLTHYQADIRKLAKLANRDLTGWLETSGQS